MRSLRIALRMCVGAGLLVCALVLLGSRADAQETVPPAEASADPPPGATVEDDVVIATSPEEPLLSDASSAPEKQVATPPDNEQHATVETNGEASSNTGGNSAEASIVDDARPSPPATNENDAASQVETGPSSAVGGQTATDVTQQASGVVSGNAGVDIVQVALVVNLGHGVANTGANVAASSAGVGSGTVGDAGALVTSGNASATGNATDTTVTQSAVVASGETSTQIATVLNVGFGAGDAGVNIAIANVIVNGAGAVALGGNASRASVSTGGASAIGNQADTSITQTAMGVASGDSRLSIRQRALVLNLGVAFANSGANAALADLTVDEQAELLAQIVRFLDPVLEQYGLFDDSATGGLGGAAVAGVQTGSATAVGNDATTTITQNVQAAASGTATTHASQLAVVANYGVAVSNTGLNAAIAQIGDGLATPSSALSTGSMSELERFFGLLQHPEQLRSGALLDTFFDSVELNGLTLHLGGSIGAIERVLGWDAALFPDGGPIEGGVRVRQITAVLDISFAWSNSGENLILAVVDASNDAGAAGADAELRAALGTVAEFGLLAEDVGARHASASATSGDAVAVGNNAIVAICQSFRDSLACAVPGDEPTTPALPVIDAVVATQVSAPAPTPPLVLLRVPAPAPAQQVAPAVDHLPVTGADARSLALTALALVGLGGVLARRRSSRQGGVQ